MEQMPPLRVVGRATEEQKARTVEQFKHFREDSSESLKDLCPEEVLKTIRSHEQPKTVQEQTLLHAIDDETNRLMIELGLAPEHIAPDNYGLMEKCEAVLPVYC